MTMGSYYYPNWMINTVGFVALALVFTSFWIAFQIENEDIRKQTVAMGVIGLSAFTALLYVLGRQHNFVIP